MAPKDPNEIEEGVDGEDFDSLLDRLTLDPQSYSETEAQVFDAGLARAAAMLPAPKPRKPLPPDLAQLYREIRTVAMKRGSLVPNAPPVLFDGYEAHSVRRGGMGLVIQARDRVLDRWVAIKLWIAAGPDAQEALLAEARTLAKFTHPNVVAVHGTGQWGDRVYFVMEWVDGVDGQEWLGEPHTWSDVRDMFVFAGEGLAAAHAAGIQHRDFKPANMLLGLDGRVLVADFGIADSLDSADPDADEGSIVGTPSYMAPERLRGGRGDARSDQYSFCVALWRGLYNMRPFAGDTRMEVLEEIERGELRESPEAEVPAWLSAVVRKGLSEDPDDRYANMLELVDALLDEPVEESSTGEETWTVGQGSEPPSSGERVIHAPGWLGAVLGAAVATGLLWFVRPVDTHPEQGVADIAGHASQPAEPVAEHCARVSGIDSPSDPTTLEVCELIAEGHIEAAELLWDKTFDSRVVANDAASTDELATDILIVAATYVEYAESANDPASARKAALNSMAWSTVAASRTDAFSDVTALIQSRARQLASSQ